MCRKPNSRATSSVSGSTTQQGKLYQPGKKARKNTVPGYGHSRRSEMVFSPLPNPQNALKIHFLKVFFPKSKAIPKKLATSGVETLSWPAGKSRKHTQFTHM